MANFMSCIDGNQGSKTIQEEEIYLAPHEQKVYDAVNNADQDFDASMELFENAHCELNVGQAPTDITVMKGPCKGKNTSRSTVPSKSLRHVFI